MSVIIRLQNLPWSANALDIRNFFRGLSIPEGGVHIVGGELGDAFIAFSTDEDARQAMMLDGGKIKEIQAKLLLSSRSEMHKVIEAARQSVPILALAPAPAPAPSPAPNPVPTPTPIIPTITPFSAALGSRPLGSFGIPGIGNPSEIPQPAVIEPPAPLVSPTIITPNVEEDKEEQKIEKKREKDRRRSRSRSKSRERDRKGRKRDRRDRSRSRERRRRDSSRSRDRRDRKRDRKERSRSSDRSPTRRSRDRRERKSPRNSQEKIDDTLSNDSFVPPAPIIGNAMNPNMPPQMQQMMPNMMMNGMPIELPQNRFNEPSMNDTFNKLQELGKKRNPNAFQGEQQNGGGRFQGGRGGGAGRGGLGFRRENRSRFESDQQQRDCCVAVRNAPTHTSYGDVRRFFPFVIDKHGIKMINDHLGRRSGTIYVRFCDPRSKQIALQRKSNELKGAQVTVEDLEDEAYETAIDSFLPFREDNDEDDQSLIIADEEPKPIFSVLKLTDLPNFVKEQDIIKTFSDFSLLSIMLNDCRITRSRIAFVQFVKAEDAQVVLDRKERYIFGRRHPTITPVSEEEYEKEKNIQNERFPDVKEKMKVKEPPVVEMPESRDPRQRRQFDNGGPKGPLVGAPPQVQPQPFFPGPFPAQPAFAPPFAAPAASPFAGFPGPGAVDPRSAAANWATRPIPANQSSMNQMKNMPTSQVPAHVQPHVQIVDLDDEILDCVLMKGLPRDATDRTIVTFLSDTGAVPARIHLMLDTNSLPSGDCFCEFRSPQEARMAATKHGHNLDGCRVTVDLVTRTVVEEALEGPKQQNEIREGILGSGPMQPQFFDAPQRGFGPRGPYRGRFDSNRGGFDSGRGGYDSSRGGFDSGRGGFDSSRGGFDSSRGGFDSSRGGFDSSRGGFDSSRGGFDSVRGGFDSTRGSFDSNRVFRGGFESRGSFRSRGFDRGSRGFDRGRGRGFARGRGGGGFDKGRDQIRQEDEADPALEDFGAPGCVVSMENVPFRATIDDIMSFFSDFELTQDDVIRRYNERGQPTGDARVAFRTPFDAQRALKTRHMEIIHDRRISLVIL